MKARKDVDNMISIVLTPNLYLSDEWMILENYKLTIASKVHVTYSCLLEMTLSNK